MEYLVMSIQEYTVTVFDFIVSSDAACCLLI